MPLLFARLGAVLFALSLGYCVYCYAVVLATPATAPAPSAAATIAFDATLFSIFALHHSLLARTRAKRWIVRLVPTGLERSVYVWIASLLLIAVCGLWQPLPGIAWTLAQPWRALGYFAQGLGAILVWRGAAVVDALELAGIRQARHDNRPLDFRIVGPFRVVRHPIYLGWMLLVFAVPTMTMSRLLFACISSAYLVVAIPFEERSLVQTFGDRYRAYRATVRWRLLPGVW